MGARAYQGQAIEVSYDAERCVHFAECVRGLPAVFEVGRRPWIVPDAADAELVAEIIRRCPSGALHYRLVDGADEEPDAPTSIRPLPDGPTLVRGTLDITTPDGGEVRETRVALCACGRTTRSPYCDGSCPTPPPAQPHH